MASDDNHRGCDRHCGMDTAVKVESVEHGYHGYDSVTDLGWCAFAVVKNGSRYYVVGDITDTAFARVTQRLRAIGAVDEYLHALKVLGT